MAFLVPFCSTKQHSNLQYQWLPPS